MIGMTLCSGIGAPEMAAPWVDWRFASEIEPFPREVLQQRFDYKLPTDQNDGDPLLWGDMCEVTPDLLHDRGIPLPDLLVAGTPCQAFSIAGLRKGVEDERGNLTIKFVEICHAIVDARSDGKLVVLWENVPGVLSDKGNAFGCFLAGLVGADDALLPVEREWGWLHKSEWAEVGGKTLEKHSVGGTYGWKRISWPSEGMVEGPRARLAWRILDAQYFGLAQRRKRVFVIIDFGGAIDPAKVLFERQGLQGNTPPSRETGEGTSEGTGSGASHWSGGPHPSLNKGGVGTPGQSNQEIFSQQGAGLVEAFNKQRIGEYSSDDIGSTCSARDYKDATDLVVAFDCKGSEVQTDETGVSPPLRAMGHNNSHKNGGGHAAVAFKPSHYIRGKDGAPSEITPPLTADADKGDQDPVIHTGPTVRRLMPLECARLQGFQDDHCAITYRGKPATDGPQYKAYGNSMAVKNIKWIMDRIKEAIDLQKEISK